MEQTNHPENDLNTDTSDNETVKPKRKILKILLWIVVFLSTSIFIVPWLIDRFYKHWLGDGVWMTSSAFSCVPLLACILFFILEYALFIEPEVVQDSCNTPKRFSGKEKTFMALVPLAVAILCSVLSVFYFDAFSTTGVESVALTNRTEYNWDDVESYTLDEDWYGKLVFKLFFNDGSHAQFIGGTTYYAWYTSKEFDTLYPDIDSDYAKELTKELTRRNIPADVQDWDALIDNLRDDCDKDLVKEIRKIANE